MGIVTSNCCHNTYANKNKEIEIDIQKTNMKLRDIIINSNRNFPELYSANLNMNMINLVNDQSINNFKVNTDVNEFESFTTSKQKEILANLKESYSPTHSIQPMPNFEVDHDQMIHLEQVVSKAPKLILEVISNFPTERYFLRINAQGLEGSLRGKKDGFTFFGTYNDEQINDNDYLLNLKNQEDKIKLKGRHFQIYYNIDTSKYFIKHLGIGFGSFMKIKSEIILRNNTLINIGDSYIVVTMDQEDEVSYVNYQNTHEQIQMINLKVFSSKTKYDPLNFQPSKTSIRIGRSSECEVVVNDSNLSRFHCFIEYNNVAGWIIKDGYIVKNKDIYEHKYSTNGTWIYLKDDYPIMEGMIFTSAQTLFLVNIFNLSVILLMILN